MLLTGAVAVVAYNPLMSVVSRLRHRAEVRHALEQSELRRRIALGRIEMIRNAAEQAMWDESLNSVSELRNL